MAVAQSQPWCAGQELWHSFDGAPMRYLRLGPATRPYPSRPPLVLIHGLLGYSFSWRHNLDALAQERETYAVDLLGIGYSDRPRRGRVDFGLHATAERMLEWLKALGLRDADRLGTSHGGAVAMMMAALEREHGSGTAVGRLLLAAPANPWSHSGAKRIAFLGSTFGGWIARLAMPRFEMGLRGARSFVLKRMYGDPGKITAETLDGYSRMLDLPGTIEYALEVVRSWRQDMRELKSRFHVLSHMPALLLWGSLDRAVAPESACELTARLKNSRLVVMKGIGHMPYEEAPEEFNRLVLDFLDGDERQALGSSPNE